MKSCGKRTEPDTRQSVTLSAVLSLLYPHERVFILHRISPHEVKAVDSGTVQELRASRLWKRAGL